MSSYVAVSGTPSRDSCNVFGLTPQEVRYLRVRNSFISRLSLSLEHCGKVDYEEVHMRSDY